MEATVLASFPIFHVVGISWHHSNNTKISVCESYSKRRRSCCCVVHVIGYSERSVITTTVEEEEGIMRLDWNPFPSSLHKQNHVLIKLFISILVMGFVFCFFFFFSSHSTLFIPSAEFSVIELQQNTSTSNKETPSPIFGKFPEISMEEDTEVSVEELEIGDQITQKEKCDLFTGDWIPDQSSPVYTSQTCDLIAYQQNCMNNGRPDSGYLYWRWRPRDCELPKFNGEKFLDLMRNKSWAFIGDSLARNHVQSLICILSQVEKAVLVYHDQTFRCQRWNFPSYNCTISAIWSPFLLEGVVFEDVNGGKSEDRLHLDKLDKKWTDQYQSFDYMVLSSGKWFIRSAIYYENNTILGCHYCPGKNLTDIPFEDAYQKSLQLVFNFITTSDHKPVTLFRTASPEHFENGHWYNGGTCKRKEPIKEGEMSLDLLDSMLRNAELKEFKKAAEVASKNGLDLKLMDTTGLSLLRPDGHPGPYRQFQPFAKDQNATVQSDCLHWCLPGPIDIWNDLMMEMVVNG